MYPKSKSGRGDKAATAKELIQTDDNPEFTEQKLLPSKFNVQLLKSTLLENNKHWTRSNILHKWGEGVAKKEENMCCLNPE